jgi:hypothetical protein
VTNADETVSFSGTQGPGKGKHIVFVSGDEEYRSEEGLPMLAQMMATHHGFTCTVLFAIDPETGCVDPECQTNIPGLHHLADADMMVMLIRFRELPDADMQLFLDYAFSGRPMLALRTSTHAFEYSRNPDNPLAKYTWNHPRYEGGFGRQVLGETWVAHHGHHGHESTRGMADVTNGSHPILHGVGPIWVPTDVYEACPPDDVNVLIEGHVLMGMDRHDPVKADTPVMPIAWVRTANATIGVGRVLCSTMGASVDLKDVSLRRLLVNGCYWCMAMEDAIDLNRSVDPVGDYQPTNFGFGAHRKGLRPVDFVPRV